MKYIFPELNDKKEDSMMRRHVQESVLGVLPMVWHRPGPETSMVCLLFSAINIDFDYVSSGILEHSYLKEEELKKAKFTQKQLTVFKM